MAYTIGKLNHISYNRASGYHRRQRVPLSRIYKHVRANIGDFFYVIGASIEREEKHIWRSIRHGARAVANRILNWLKRLWILVYTGLLRVSADLFNPFIKAYRSVKGLFAILKEMKGLPFRMLRGRGAAFFRYGCVYLHSFSSQRSTVNMIGFPAQAIRPSATVTGLPSIRFS